MQLSICVSHSSCNLDRKCSSTYGPEIVHNQIENTQNDNEKSRAELGLESNNYHDTGTGAQDGDSNTPDGPLAAENKADEQEDEQHTSGQLEVHLAVLLIELGQASESLSLAHPRVRQDHEQTANDGQVAEEEVQVEDEAVAKGLGHDHTHKAGDSIVRVLPDDNEGRTGCHGEDVGDEEQMGNATGNCALRLAHIAPVNPLGGTLFGGPVLLLRKSWR